MPMICISHAGEFVIDEQTFTVNLQRLKMPLSKSTLIEYITDYMKSFGHRVIEVVLFTPDQTRMIDPSVHSKLSFDIIRY